MSWFLRKALPYATVTLHVKEYVDSEKPLVYHIDIDQIITGGITGTKESRTLDWEERSHVDTIFGTVHGRSRMFRGAKGDDGKTRPAVDVQSKVGESEADAKVQKFLRGEIQLDGSASEGFIVDDEGAEFGPGEDGWEAYFEDLFEQVTKEKLDEMKKEYQGILDLHSLTAFTDCHLRPGSEEELEDLKVAYAEADGSIEIIMQHIPHSTFDDEARFIVIISDLINKGKLPSLKTWESSVKDEKARLVRRKQSDKEAKEAEELAKELGVWDEFYGSGKASAKKSKGKGKGKGKATEEEEDHSALQALILKRKKNREGFFDNLAAKYAEPDPSTKGKNRKGKKRSVADEEAEEEAPPPKKKAKKDPPENMDIDDEEFEALQQRLFGDKAKRTASGPSTPAKGKNTRSKRAR